jgi:hypothetical protein
MPPKPAILTLIAIARTPDELAVNSFALLTRTSRRSMNSPFLRIIIKGRCYVEYRGKVYLNGQCTIAIGYPDVVSVGSPTVDGVENLTAYVVGRFEGGPRTAVLNPITFKNLGDVWFGDVNSSDNGSCWSNQIGKLCAWKEQ